MMTQNATSFPPAWKSGGVLLALVAFAKFAAHLRTASNYGFFRPYENGSNILIGRRLRVPIAEVWPGTRHFD